MLAEILYTIYTEDDNNAEKIIHFFDGMNYFDSGISHCRSDWDDNGVVVHATVTEDWTERHAAKAIEKLMNLHHLVYDDVEAEFAL